MMFSSLLRSIEKRSILCFILKCSIFVPTYICISRENKVSLQHCNILIADVSRSLQRSHIAPKPHLTHSNKTMQMEHL